MTCPTHVNDEDTPAKERTRLSAVRERWRRASVISRAAWVVLVVMGVLAGVWGGGAVVAGGVVQCDSCHAMTPYVTAAQDSAHSGTNCRACHTGTGPVAALVNAPRAWGWISSAVLGREARPVAISDAPCRDCHNAVLDSTVESRGIRVRHSDFEASSCYSCHPGIGHPISDRHYIGVQMADCTSCHRTSAVRIESCDLCHVSRSTRATGASSWRAAHGQGWEKAHGMGNLTGCTDCHAPSYCASCHGLAMPHPAQWPRSHGESAKENGASCPSCHEATWCESCHGVAMPHPAEFLASHPTQVENDGAEICHRCHSVQVCERCHISSSHPLVPGVRSDAHGGAR
ncbi:MAG: hypothetical protein Q8K89_13745 [Actinomycetota bacterium]|nr:hypothetical protein [Actinomycetota bacterium]